MSVKKKAGETEPISVEKLSAAELNDIKLDENSAPIEP